MLVPRCILSVLSLAAAATATLHHQAHHVVQRDGTTAPVAVATTSASINVAQVSSFLNGWLSKNPVTQQFTRPTETLAISVPASLQVAIMTAVPATVIIELMNPTARASVASEFAAGHTPSWYQTLPPDVKSFFESMAAQLSTGGGIYTVTPTPTATAGADDNPGAAAASSTSSAYAAKATGLDRGVLAGVVGLAGVLGVAIAL
ncbi:hypothetical protein GQ53DRAFT_888442 [Thozetella sp. PMI_491]|nr:hypothetical protein GQ53DRAFT_888442 [Thozetella sp. PMI_491]